MTRIISFVKRNKLKNENSFHLSIAPILFLAQFFGMLPVTGVLSKNIHSIRFKFLSFRTLHSAFWLISALIFLYLEIRRLYRQEINQKSLGGLTFYGLSIMASIIFMHMATKWNQLLLLFKDVEDTLNNSPYFYTGKSLKKRMKSVSLFMLAFGLSEHLLSWYSYLNDRFIQADVCKWQIGSWFYYLATLHLGHIYDVFPVNMLTVIWAEYMNLAFTFTWSFVDLFIMLMGLSIVIQFKILNERIDLFKERIVPSSSWDEVRCHYNKICDLNEFIDDMLGSMICVASLSDLYSVCFQLLNIATPIPFLANKIYTWYSLLYLIFRTYAMLLITSSVNDESMKPVGIFRTIPSSGWNPELQRFCNQVQQNRVALSGKSFFFLTRGIIISIAGTIVTYELVLLQFDGTEILPGMFNPCGVVANSSSTITQLDE